MQRTNFFLGISHPSAIWRDEEYFKHKFANKNSEDLFLRKFCNVVQSKVYHEHLNLHIELSNVSIVIQLHSLIFNQIDNQICGALLFIKWKYFQIFHELREKSSHFKLKRANNRMNVQFSSIFLILWRLHWDPANISRLKKPSKQWN